MPWLSAQGELAYRPEAPPSRDYFFQYGWVLPAVFAPGLARRRHLYFGAYHRDDADDVFSFWSAARSGAVSPVHQAFGRATVDAVTAPIAAYRHTLRGRPTYVLVQHGSYQLVDEEDQPLLSSGVALLYRGIQKARAFRLPGELDSALPEVWSSYLRAQARMLSDSALSFSSVHDRAARCETGHLKDRSWVSDDIARGCGLSLDSNPAGKRLWDAGTQSFSLARWVAANKFGPHYVVAKSPLDNLRITTFFAGEHEVRVVDPRRLDFVEAVGCEVRAALRRRA